MTRVLGQLFGFFAFRSRIKGVYFSIMTQALTFAGMLLFFRNETGFGGNNGFTNFRSILGFGITEPGTRAVLFFATVLLLLASLFAGWRLARSKFGRVLTALRDAENRLMFCGYDPRGFKLFVWVLSAVLCGLAGALYVPQVGIINPGEMSPTNSIEAAVWVALGNIDYFVQRQNGQSNIGWARTIGIDQPGRIGKQLGAGAQGRGCYRGGLWQCGNPPGRPGRAGPATGALGRGARALVPVRKP